MLELINILIPSLSLHPIFNEIVYFLNSALFCFFTLLLCKLLDDGRNTAYFPLHLFQSFELQNSTLTHTIKHSTILLHTNHYAHTIKQPPIKLHTHHNFFFLYQKPLASVGYFYEGESGLPFARYLA